MDNYLMTGRTKRTRGYTGFPFFPCLKKNKPTHDVASKHINCRTYLVKKDDVERNPNFICENFCSFNVMFKTRPDPWWLYMTKFSNHRVIVQVNKWFEQKTKIRNVEFFNGLANRLARTMVTRTEKIVICVFHVWSPPPSVRSKCSSPANSQLTATYWGQIWTDRATTQDRGF